MLLLRMLPRRHSMFKPTSTLLKAIAASWLRYKKQCPIIFTERILGFVHGGKGIADLMAITKDRRLIEVEIKITLHDFKKDAKKRKWNWQKYESGGYWDHYIPSQFYYMVPPDLVEKVKPLLDEDKGLLTYVEDINPNIYNNLPELIVMKSSKAIHRNKIPIRDMIETVRHQSGTICSLFNKLAKLEQERVKI